MTDKVEKTKPSFEKRLRGVLLIVVISGMLVPVMSFLAWRISLSMRLNAKLKAIANAGYPTRIAEIQKMYYSEIRPDENAALFFRDAFAHIPVSKGRKPAMPLWPGINSRSNAAFLAATNTAQVVGILRENADLLAILRKAPAGQKSRYPIDFSLGVAIPLPHLQHIRDSIGPLLLDAAVQADQGGAQQATEDIEAALHLSGSLRNEPILVSQLSRISCRQKINAALERVLSKQRLTDVQLLDLIHSIEQEDNPHAMERAMAGEQCLGIDFHETPTQMSSAGGQPQNPDDDPPPSPERVARGFAFLKAIGLIGTDLDYYLEIMPQRVALAKVASPENVLKGKALDEKVSESAKSYHVYRLYADLTLPSVHRIESRHAGDVARLSQRLTALAIERYRLANQDHLPARLTDLVPAFLPSVPQDPFDGQPLRFKPLEKGYVIYSIGPDLKDDGGREWQPRPRGSTNDVPYDITFIVDR